MNRSAILAMACILAVGSLGGCTDFRRALGMEKSPPDEFAVLQGAPLTIPPDFGLRPPHNTDKPPSLSPMQQAEVTVFKASGANEAAAAAGPGGAQMTPGEQALLAHAGAGKADPRIRQEIDSESAQVADASDSFVDSLLFWKSTPVPGTPVDADAEARRIGEDRAMGRPVTAGEAPVAERTGRTWLGGLF